jgi:GrpB-like predicted nucleotidyltransferase (UPF0157 family)
MTAPEPIPVARGDRSTIGLNKREVELLAHDPGWLGLGEEERRAVASALGELALGVEHVGSTAVPELAAKPIIDIAVALHAAGASQGAAVRARMTGAGYIDRGQAADGGGWLFVRESMPDVRVAHVHLVAIDDPEWRRYLRFRDLLRSNPAGRDPGLGR